MKLFRCLPIEEPTLALSHVLRATLLTFEFIETHGPIELTPELAFHSQFVAWASEAFDWPHFSARTSHGVVRLLDDEEFLPLVVVHDLLIATSFIQRDQGLLRMTPRALELRSKPNELWFFLVNNLLFLTDHNKYAQGDGAFTGDWAKYMIVLNNMPEAGLSDTRLCAMIYGGGEARFRNDDHEYVQALYVHVLQPLAWAGLLTEERNGHGADRVCSFTRTPLWAAALQVGAHPPLAH